MLRTHLTLVLALSAGAVACGSAESGGSAAGGPGPEPLLDLPTDGLQLTSQGTTIRPGEDVEYCELAYLPGGPDDEILMNRYEAAIDGYSHHLLVFAATPGSDAEKSLTEKYVVGKAIPCQAGRDLGIGFTIVAGTQQPYSDVQYPPNVGRRLRGGQPILWNYHHVNGSEQDGKARHAVNLHVVDRLDFIAQTGAFVNLTIDTPPRADAAFTGDCRFSHDVRVWSISRHTHEWGTDFDVWYAGGERDGRHFWKSTDYENDVNYRWEDTTVMKAGEGFRFTCAYSNPTDQPLRFGQKASDEMCILFSQWWVLEPADVVPSQFCAMTSIDEDGVARAGEVPGLPGL